MIFSKLKKSKSGRSLWLDIGSSFIKYAIEVDDKNERHILLAEYERGGVQMWDSSWAKKVSSILSNEDISNAYVSFCPSLFKSCLFEYGKKREVNSVISAREEKEIYRKARDKASSEMRSYYEDVFGIPGDQLSIEDIGLVRQDINGYEVKELRGHKASTVALRLFISCIPSDHAERIRKLAKESGVDNMKLIHPLVGADGHMSEARESAIYVDIGDKSTQLAVWRNGSLEIVEDVQHGSKDVTKNLKDSLGLTVSRATEMKRRYSKGELSKQSSAKLRDMILPTVANWSKMCVKALKQYPIVFPSKIYMVGGGAMLPESQEVVSEQFTELPMAQAPKVEILHPADVYDKDTPRSDDAEFTPLFLLRYGKRKQ